MTDKLREALEREQFEQTMHDVYPHWQFTPNAADGYMREETQAAWLARNAIHYPECWDTAAYPTVWAAMGEVYAAFSCTNQDTHAPPEPVASVAFQYRREQVEKQMAGVYAAFPEGQPASIQPVKRRLQNIADGVRLYGAPDRELLARRLDALAGELEAAAERAEPVAFVRWEWNRSGSKSLVFEKPAELSLAEVAKGVVYEPLYTTPAQPPAALETCQNCGDLPYPGCSSEFQGEPSCRFWPAAAPSVEAEPVRRLVDAAMAVISRHDEWVRQMPAGAFDDPLSVSLAALHDAAETVGISLDIVRRYAAPLQQPQEGWVSVDERLPEKFVEVLVAFADSSLPSTGQYTANPNDHDGWCYPKENCDWMDGSWPTVTHWMPLPDHPHEELFAPPAATNQNGAGDA